MRYSYLHSITSFIYILAKYLWIILRTLKCALAHFEKNIIEISDINITYMKMSQIALEYAIMYISESVASHHSRHS